MSKKITQEIAENKSLAVGIKIIGKYINNSTDIDFECPFCKKIFPAKPANIWSKNTTSCGCYNKKVISDRSRANLLNMQFGLLNIIQFSHINKYQNTIWKCKCACGNIKYISAHQLLKPKGTKSCGCLQKQSLILNNKNKILNTKRAITRRIPKNGNSLAEKCSEALILWDYKKNYPMTPYDINYSTKYKVWMMCDINKHDSYFVSVKDFFHSETRCPKCNMSHGERKICQLLDSLNIKYEQQKKFDKLRGLNKQYLKFDFYLPDYDLLIEYHGKQHFNETIFVEGDTFEKLQKRDKIKEDYARQNHKYLMIPYTEYDNIEEILRKELQIV